MSVRHTRQRSRRAVLDTTLELTNSTMSNSVLNPAKDTWHLLRTVTMNAVDALRWVELNTIAFGIGANHTKGAGTLTLIAGYKVVGLHSDVQTLLSLPLTAASDSSCTVGVPITSDSVGGLSYRRKPGENIVIELYARASGTGAISRLCVGNHTVTGKRVFVRRHA